VSRSGPRGGVVRAVIDNDGSWFVVTRASNRPQPDAHRLRTFKHSNGHFDAAQYGLRGRAIAIEGTSVVYPCPKCFKAVAAAAVEQAPVTHQRRGRTR
jgi:hypothetical protein